MFSTESTGWESLAGEVIMNTITDCIVRNGQCNVMLTGGETAENLYTHLADNPEVSLKNINFYFGDERCVSPTHKDSNYGMVMKSLFVKGMPYSSAIYRIKAEDNDLESVAETYSKLLPSKIDVLLLGMGDDGHVASLFPESDVYEKECTTVIPVIGNKLPYKRISVTPKLISDSKEVFLLAKGKKKGKVLAKAMAEPGNYRKLPVCLALEATWLLDTDACRQILVID